VTRNDHPSSKKIRNTALLLGAIALAIYLGYILSSVV
jgi:hypothetical protein